MHDGYLFTLGICGSASDSGPAPAILDAMLAALPPVKRAAYLGEVLISEGQPSFDDPLTAAIAADIADAELLLVVVPLLGGALPGRIHTLAQLKPAPPVQGGRFAVLVSLGASGPETLRSLHEMLARAGAQLAGELLLPLDTDPTSAAHEASTLARQAYSLARAQHPEALPQV